MSWPTKRLDELGLVSRGRSRHRPRNDPSLYGGIFPFVQTGDVKHAGLYITSHSQTYNDDGLAQSKLWPAGTLCITIAANIADTSILSYDACFPDSVIGFIPDPGLADARFVKYFMDTVQERYQRVAQGAAQDNLNQKKLLSFPIPAPDLAVQERVADILAAYDDLIENNNRRIAVLEEAIHLLYREWFVYLRFPGHDRVEVADGVPEGWHRVSLGEVSDLRWGDTKTTKASYVDDGYPAYSASGQDGLLDHYDYDHDGIVLSAIGAHCGKTWFATGVWSCIKNTIRFWSVHPHVSTEYLYCATAVPAFWPKRGAAQPFISQGDARGTTVLVPPEVVAAAFDEVVKPCLVQVAQLGSANARLREARDALLPRLMNGSIAV